MMMMMMMMTTTTMADFSGNNGYGYANALNVTFIRTLSVLFLTVPYRTAGF